MSRQQICFVALVLARKKTNGRTRNLYDRGNQKTGSPKLERYSYRWRVALLISASAFLSACTSPLPTTNTQPKQVGCITKTEGWSAENPSPQHSNTDDFAISPDGRYAVIAQWETPSNQIDLIDLESMTGWRLSYPVKKMTLAHPVFSADGKRLAFVVTPHGNFGVAKIWIGSPQGETEQTIGDMTQGYKYPTFSLDGKRLAYWRDVLPEATVPLTRKENLSSAPWALFERDLTSLKEKQLATQAFSWPCGLFYDTRSDGWFYCATNPMSPRPEKGTTKLWWGPGDNSEYRDRIKDSRTFYLKRGEEIPPKPEPFLPIDGTQPMRASVRNVLSDGRLFLEASVADETSPYKERLVGMLYGGHKFETAIDAGWKGAQRPKISADGNIAFAKLDDIIDTGVSEGLKTCKGATHYFLQKRGAPLKRFEYEDIKFDPNVHVLRE